MAPALDRSDSEEPGWGTSKADYYGADVIETEQDALEEEAEARRLQQKHLAGLSEADFGFDDLDEVEDAEETEKGSNYPRQDNATDVLSSVQLSERVSPVERLKLLHSLYPEFEHLRREHLHLQPILEDLQTSASTSKTMQAKRLALSSYMSCLSMYFALLASPASKKDVQQSKVVTILAPQRVRSHPIMARLVSCRDLWSRVAGLEEEEEDYEEDVPGAESEILEIDAPTLQDQDAAKPNLRKRKRKSRAERAAEAAAAQAEVDRQARIRRAQEDFADLPSLARKAATKPTSTTKAAATTNQASAEDDDFGDEVALTAEEAAEKARRKKSLRFYTSQIAQKSNKRERRGLMAGGDDDIPYRERFRDRQARTMDHPEDRFTRTKAEASGSDSEDVENDLTQIKPVKRRRDQLGEEGDGKRKIGYDIEKNKGLTPHRKKEVRNPRVKKRMRYEDKKKKLGSRKALYKGGEGKGGYGGERTGINTNVIKSVKLG